MKNIFTLFIAFTVVLSFQTSANAFSSRNIVDLKSDKILSLTLNEEDATSNITSSFLEPFTSSFETMTGPPSIFEEDFEEEGGIRRKKTSRALLLSLLVPGAGEYYLGDKRNATVFWVVEGAIWTTFLGFQVYGKWEEDRYKSWAVDYAHINTNGKDTDYYQNIGLYNDIEEYNFWTYLFEGSESNLYPETAQWYWEWESNEARLYYKDLRHSAEKSFRNSNIMIGFAILNRLLSGINVLRLSRFEQPQEEDISLKIRLENQKSGDTGVKLTLSKSFY